MAKYNIANLTREEIRKINVDLIAANIAFKERYNIPVIVEMIEREQPAHLRNWFRERLFMHRLTSIKFSQINFK